MDYQQIFRRKEQKYRVPAEELPALMKILQQYFRPDIYYEGTNCSLYYDTPDHRLITDSMEKPAFRQKLRMRSYGTSEREQPVFIELKKKYSGITYKRRESLSLAEAEALLKGDWRPEGRTRTLDEIIWFLDQYDLEPSMFIAYDRLSYRGIDAPELRATIDRNIRYRTADLFLGAGSSGHLLDLGGDAIMELKTNRALPMGHVRSLKRLGVFPGSFSKDEACYTQEQRARKTNRDRTADAGRKLSDMSGSIWKEYQRFAADYTIRHGGHMPEQGAAFQSLDPAGSI